MAIEDFMNNKIRKEFCLRTFVGNTLNKVKVNSGRPERNGVYLPSDVCGLKTIGCI